MILLSVKSKTSVELRIREPIAVVVSRQWTSVPTWDSRAPQMPEIESSGVTGYLCCAILFGTYETMDRPFFAKEGRGLCKILHKEENRGFVMQDMPDDCDWSFHEEFGIVQVNRHKTVISPALTTKKRHNNDVKCCFLLKISILSKNRKVPKQPWQIWNISRKYYGNMATPSPLTSAKNTEPGAASKDEGLIRIQVRWLLLPMRSTADRVGLFP